MVFPKPRFGCILATKRVVAAIIVLAFGSLARASSQTQVLDAKYNHKFAEVLQDGLEIGNCAGVTFAGGDLGAHDVSVGVGIDDNGVGKVANMFKCATQPLHKGEILSIEKVRTADHGRRILLHTATASPHSWTRHTKLGVSYLCSDTRTILMI